MTEHRSFEEENKDLEKLLVEEDEDGEEDDDEDEVQEEESSENESEEGEVEESDNEEDDEDGAENLDENDNQKMVVNAKATDAANQIEKLQQKNVSKNIKSSLPKKKKSDKRPATGHLVNVAIKHLNNRKGSSVQAIRKYIEMNFPDFNKVRMRLALKKYLIGAVADGALIQTRGNGAVGSFKLSAKVIKEEHLETKNKAKKAKEKLKELAKQEPRKQKEMKKKMKIKEKENKVKTIEKTENKMVYIY